MKDIIRAMRATVHELALEGKDIQDQIMDLPNSAPSESGAVALLSSMTTVLAIAIALKKAADKLESEMEVV